jgi:hypothetical protein
MSNRIGKRGINEWKTERLKLYRAVSAAEYKDFKTDQNFRTAENTIEGKQFFKSLNAVLEFVEASVNRGYRPPYKCVITITIENQSLESIAYEAQILDGHEAITIQEEDLPSFNNYCTFEVIQNV